MSDDHRLAEAERIAREAGAHVLSLWRSGDLAVEEKGHQDWVTSADRESEEMIVSRLSAAFPEDGIVGEEGAAKASGSGLTWVIDPIDGTTNFLRGMPAWCVVIAGVRGAETEIGVIHDPVHGETWTARRGAGAWLNGAPIRVSGAALSEGPVSTGHCNRIPPAASARLVSAVLEAGGVFHRNGSGALSLAYVACGRLVGYAEAHMNAWDCLAGQLMIAEAGGMVEAQDASEMIRAGGRVIAGGPAVFGPLREICAAAWG